MGQWACSEGAVSLELAGGGPVGSPLCPWIVSSEGQSDSREGGAPPSNESGWGCSELECSPVRAAVAGTAGWLPERGIYPLVGLRLEARGQGVGRRGVLRGPVGGSVPCPPPGLWRFAGVFTFLALSKHCPSLFFLTERPPCVCAQPPFIRTRVLLGKGCPHCNLVTSVRPIST